MNWSQMWDQIQILFVSTMAITATAIVALIIIGLAIFHPKSPIQWIVAAFRDEMLSIAASFKASYSAALTENKALVISAMIIAIGLASLSTGILVGLVLNALLSNPL